MLCVLGWRDADRMNYYSYLGGTLRRSRTLVYVVCTGVARCRQGVSSAALATHCLGRGNAIGAEEITGHRGVGPLVPIVRG